METDLVSDNCPNRIVYIAGQNYLHRRLQFDSADIHG
jgi:hypothetical protein